MRVRVKCDRCLVKVECPSDGVAAGWTQVRLIRDGRTWYAHWCPDCIGPITTDWDVRPEPLLTLSKSA